MKAVERLDDHQTHLLHSPEHGEIRIEGMEESLGMEESFGMEEILGMEESLGLPACRAGGDCVSESCFCSQGAHQGAPGPYGRRASTARKVPDGS